MSNWFKDFGDFLWAVLNNWAGYTTGGVVVALIAFWSAISAKSIRKGFALSLAVFFLFMATLKAWRDQHSALATCIANCEAATTSLQHKLDDLSVPRLNVFIDELGVGDVRTSNKSTIPGVFLIANVTNTGAPSIAENWLLKVTLNDGKTGEFAAVYLNPKYSVGGLQVEGGFPAWKVSHADALYVKTMNQPIERGMKIRGILLFQSKDFPVKEMKKAGTRFLLSCTDVSGKRSSGEMVMTGIPQPHSYYPGLGPVPQ